jgi:hypothetical protein
MQNMTSGNKSQRVAFKILQVLSIILFLCGMGFPVVKQQYFSCHSVVLEFVQNLRSEFLK